MKALTIWQPWASLIAIGAKPYEFRGWAAPRALRGQRIVIHSGVRPMRRQELQALWLRLTGREPWRTGLVADKALPLLKRVMAGLALPMGHGLGTAILGEPTKNPDLPGMPACGDGLSDSDRNEHCNYAWPLTDWQDFAPPIPCRGAQGFWDWPSDLRQSGDALG